DMVVLSTDSHVDLSRHNDRARPVRVTPARSRREHRRAEARRERGELVERRARQRDAVALALRQRACPPLARDEDVHRTVGARQALERGDDAVDLATVRWQIAEARDVDREREAVLTG